MALLLPNVVEFKADASTWSAVVYAMPLKGGSGWDWEGAANLALQSARDMGLSDPEIIKQTRGGSVISTLEVEGEHTNERDAG